MDMNIIVSGVGGQGILSIAFVLDNAAMKEGYRFKQAEVHGMSQRGGAVQSHIRFSKNEIWSDLIAEGSADLVLSVDPLEALRYVQYLKPDGVVISSSTPFRNISDYPEPGGLYEKIALLERHVLLDSGALAKLAGSAKAQNMVMLGAAAPLLPFSTETCLEFVDALFKSKGEKAVDVNRNAFDFGARMSGYFRAALEKGLLPADVRVLAAVLDPRDLEDDSLPVWKEIFKKHPGLASKAEADGEKISGTTARALELLDKGAI